MSDTVSIPLLGLLNSAQYHSIYPPLLQGVFALAAWLGGESVQGGIIALRCLTLLAETTSILLIIKLLRTWNLPDRHLILYALNPLIITEFVGNAHGEVFMIPFLLGTLLLLEKGTWSWAAAALSGAVGVKLLPLMFLPFLPRKIGWGRTILTSLLIASLVALMYLPFITANLAHDTLATLRLYFANFEFNGSIYYLIREFGFWWKGYNIIGLTSVWLPRVVAVIILAIAWYDRDSRIKTLPRQWMFAWAVYYFFATTVNPWYIAVLAVFLPFVKHRFALLWVLLIPLSYHAFSDEAVGESGWFLAAQYVPVYFWLFMELGLLLPLQRWWALKKAHIKLQRLEPLITERETLLEVGSGNGALTHLLRNKGHRVNALDIEDRSIFTQVMPVVYEGHAFPFRDHAFSTCQLITMLHHTPDPEHIIAEAMRVADRVIIMEDVYESNTQRWLTYLTDSIVNCEFHGHPHTNRTETGWRETFERLGLHVESCQRHRFLGLFRQVTFLLSAKQPMRPSVAR